MLIDYRRRTNQESQLGNSGSRNSDAGATKKFTCVVLGDVLRIVHAHRPPGFDVLFRTNDRDFVDDYDFIMRWTSSRLCCAYCTRVYTFQR